MLKWILFICIKQFEQQIKTDWFNQVNFNEKMLNLITTVFEQFALN